MSAPSWPDGPSRELYAEAEAYGASSFVLSDVEMARTFVNTKKNVGKF